MCHASQQMLTARDGVNAGVVAAVPCAGKPAMDHKDGHCTAIGKPTKAHFCNLPEDYSAMDEHLDPVLATLRDCQHSSTTERTKSPQRNA